MAIHPSRIKDSGVPKDKANEKQLKKKLKSLALPTPANNSSPIEAAIDTKHLSRQQMINRSGAWLLILIKGCVILL